MDMEKTFEKTYTCMVPDELLERYKIPDFYRSPEGAERKIYLVFREEDGELTGDIKIM